MQIWINSTCVHCTVDNVDSNRYARVLCILNSIEIRCINTDFILIIVKCVINLIPILDFSPVTN